jgi:hypothetical protein
MLKLKAHSGFHDLFLNLLKHFQLIALGARFQYNYCLYRMLLTLRYSLEKSFYKRDDGFELDFID